MAFFSHFGRLFAVVILSLSYIANPSRATDVRDPNVIPHIDEKGRFGYQSFLQGEGHRAFTIASGGAWAWSSGQASAEAAEQDALKNCAQYTGSVCITYAIDDDVVFDWDAWTASWDLNMEKEAVATAPVGVIRGTRFPDLSVTAPDGKAITLSDLLGKVVFLHVWGSWCTPCQKELPELQKLYDAFEDQENIVFVLIQTREPISKSRRWAKRKDIDLPFYDSGSTERKDAMFRMANGSRIHDRRIAARFPSSYVLDANGIVAFSHVGAIHGWPQYEPLIRHIIPR